MLSSPNSKKNEDERIRKELLRFIENWKNPNNLGRSHDYPMFTKNEEQCNKYITWLEKQGEQKPAVKVEPKCEFEVGDWITFYGGTAFKIIKIEAEINGVLNYLLLGQDGKASYYGKRYVDENAKLWTIEDAQDGDVLAFDNDTIVIFKNLHNTTSFSFDSYCHIKNGVFNFSRDDYMIAWCNGIDFHPTTKEQRDLLFQKMREAGYEWSSEHRKLIKME